MTATQPATDTLLTGHVLSSAFNRRSMLRGIGVTGLGAVLSPLLMSGGAADAATPNRATRRALAKTPAKGKRTKRVGSGASAQPTPYTLQASSELSRDFFMTSEVLIQSGDYVLPFTNPKNGSQVEALILTGGSVSHLRRDSTSPTGWSYAAAFDLPTGFTPVKNVAIAANDTDVYVLVFGDPDGFDHITASPLWVTKLAGPHTWDTGSVSTYNGAGFNSGLETESVKGGFSRSGVPYFVATRTYGGTTYFNTWVVSGDWDSSPLVAGNVLDLDTSTLSVRDYTILYDTNPSDKANPTGFAVILTSDGDLTVYPQEDLVFDPTLVMTNAGAQNVTELLWAWASPSSTTHYPGYAFQTAAGTVFVDENANYNTVADVALSASSNAVAVWQQDDLFTVNVLDSDGTLQMVQELSSSGTGSWATPIPLVPDLQSVFGVPTDPSENTLFAVGLDETLNVLTLGPTGWTQTRVHQVGEEAYDFAAYRVQATITDANGTAVAGAAVTISTDRPVGAWTPNGGLAITPDAPLTVTADMKGEVTFSIPAEELDVAILTLQALDADNNPTGATFLVTADTDLKAFLGGTGALTDLGTLTGASLTGATQSGTSTPLFPALTGAAAANASVQALNQLIKTGTDAQNNTTQSGTAFVLDLSSGTPSYSTSTASQAKLEGQHLEFSFGHLFDSIGHAIRHAAMTVTKVVVRLADDASSWVVDLALKIGDEIVNFTDLVIADMKSAFHIIGGFFATLGADILHAVEWLMHDIVAFLKDVKVTVGHVQGWLGEVGTNVTSALAAVKIDTDTWFSSKEQQAHDAISSLKNLAEGTLGGPPLPPPSNDTGSAHDQSALIKDMAFIGKVMNDAPGKWLMDKLFSYLPATDPGPTIAQSTFEPLIQDLATDWGDAMALSEALYTFIETTMTDAFSTNGSADPGKLSDAQITAWFSDLDTVVHDGLLLLDALADSALDLTTAGVALTDDFFTYQYNVVASMGILGLILEEVGVDIHFSLAEILSWTISFPATLIGQIRGYNALFPATESASTADRQNPHQDGNRRTQRLGKDPDGWQVGLGIVGAVTQIIWGMADMVEDLQSFKDTKTGKKGEYAGVLDYFDILCPLVETVVLWPSEPNSDGSASYPFHGGLATSTKLWQMLPFVIWSAVIPSVFGAFSKAGWTSDMSGSAFPPGTDNIWTTYMYPFAQMISGIVNTVLGGVYSGENDAGWVAILGTVLGNLTFIGAPLPAKFMAEATSDVSVLVKMLLDAVANIGAGVCLATATSLPTP